MQVRYYIWLSNFILVSNLDWACPVVVYRVGLKFLFDKIRCF
jgi:hypothetical protein